MATEAEIVDSADKAGIPQLDFSSFPHQIFWLAVFLVAIFIVVRRIALPRVGEILSRREKRIQLDLEEARQINAQAEELEAQIAQTLTEAKQYSEMKAAEARNEIQTIKAAATVEAERVVRLEAEEADRAIQTMRTQSVEAIREIAKTTAAEIVNQIVPSRGIYDRISKVVDPSIKGQQND